jgi:hypothetical protein
MSKKIVRCEWRLDADEHGDSWDTDCGHKYQFFDGGPIENGQRYCGYCGKPLKVTRAAQRKAT